MVPIEIADFADDGIFLMPPGDPHFDQRAHAILLGDAAAALDLKPCLTIFANRNPRTVVAYTVAWSVTRRNESTETTYTQFKFPDAVAGTGSGLAVLQGREVRCGEERLVGMGFEVWPPEYADSYRSFGLEQLHRLGDIRQIRIAVDGVIFDDGTLLGPDESRLAEHFILYVQAKQQIYRDVVSGIENDFRSDEVFAPYVKRLATVPDPTDPIDTYTHQAAAEALAWRDRVLAEIFRRALRRAPFTIRPKTS